MTVGERIKSRRKELGISADRLAEILKVSRSTIFRYENGDIEKLPVSVLEPIAAILNTTPAYLMGWENEDGEVDIVLAAIESGMDTDEVERLCAKTKLVTDDDELNSYLEALRTRPEMRMLFKLSKGATKEDVENAVKIIEALQKK